MLMRYLSVECKVCGSGLSCHSYMTTSLLLPVVLSLQRYGDQAYFTFYPIPPNGRDSKNRCSLSE